VHLLSNLRLYAKSVAVVLFACMFLMTAKPAEAAMASYYGNELAGNLTASGAVFNPGAYTAAHKAFPFGTKVQFCYQGCLVATINDRGPFVGDREYDLSKATAVAIGVTPAGTGDVTATVL
jgi:rare lipoprotein A